MNAILGFTILAVITLLIVDSFITAGNFSGTVSTLVDIIPIAIAGLAVYFVVSAFGSR